MDTGLRVKKTLLEAQDMRRALRRMAGEILERQRNLEDLLLVGILTRGVPVAQEIADEIARAEGARIPIGRLDITLYRDDLSTIAPHPVVKQSHFPFDIDGKIVVLCDDVLYTGRTVRAALDALVDYGRPQAVRLAVLIDRGHRELPIHADFVGRDVQTAANEVIKVSFPGTDSGKELVQLLEKAPAGS